MKIVGCDLQSIAMLDRESGELTEKIIRHEGNAVREFYAALEGPTVVGIEATGSMQWFLELLEELGIQYRVGHPAKIRAAETRPSAMSADETATRCIYGRCCDRDQRLPSAAETQRIEWFLPVVVRIRHRAVPEEPTAFPLIARLLS